MAKKPLDGAFRDELNFEIKDDLSKLFFSTEENNYNSINDKTNIYKKS